MSSPPLSTTDDVITSTSSYFTTQNSTSGDQEHTSAESSGTTSQDPSNTFVKQSTKNKATTADGDTTTQPTDSDMTTTDSITSMSTEMLHTTSDLPDSNVTDSTNTTENVYTTSTNENFTTTSELTTSGVASKRTTFSLSSSPSPTETIATVPSDNLQLQMVLSGEASGWEHEPHVWICTSCSKSDTGIKIDDCKSVANVQNATDNPQDNSYEWSVNLYYKATCQSLYVTWAVQFLINGTLGYVKNGEFKTGLLYETSGQEFRKIDTAASGCNSQQAIYIQTQWEKTEPENFTCGALFYTTTKSPISFNTDRFSSPGSVPFSITYPTQSSTTLLNNVQTSTQHSGLQKTDVIVIVCCSTGVVILVFVVTSCVVKRNAAKRKRSMRQMTFDDMDEPPLEITSLMNGARSGGQLNRSTMGVTNSTFSGSPSYELVDNPDDNSTPMYSFTGDVEDVWKKSDHEF